MRFLPFGKPCPFWMAISKQSIHVDQPEQMEEKNLDKPGDPIQNSGPFYSLVSIGFFLQHTPGAYRVTPTVFFVGIPFTWGWKGDSWGMCILGYLMGFSWVVRFRGKFENKKKVTFSQNCQEEMMLLYLPHQNEVDYLLDLLTTTVDGSEILPGMYKIPKIKGVFAPYQQVFWPDFWTISPVWWGISIQSIHP